MMGDKGMDRVERHCQSVRRVQLLCDMHGIRFGSPKNLGELIASLKDDRHFAMDFWALVGDLSARERGTLSDEEMLDVVVEASSGAHAGAVPHGQRSNVEELNQLLAGVDVAHPANLPDAIAEPDDALLAAYRDRGKPRLTRPGTPVVVLPERTAGTMRVGARVRLTGTDDTWVARRSIGEALSRLERTSTELREQLAAIDEQLVEQTSQAAVVPEPQEVEPEPREIVAESLKSAPEPRGIAPEPQMIAPEPREVVREPQRFVPALQEIVPEPPKIVPEPQRFVSEPRAIVREPEEIMRKQNPVSVEAAEAIAAREILMRALGNMKEPQETVAVPPAKTRAEGEAARAKQIEEERIEAHRKKRNEMEREAEVFPPRPIHTLSQRGLATPLKDEGPSIPVPLSRYAREESVRGGRRVRVAVVAAALLLTLAAGGAFFFSRTETGHDTLARMGPVLREQYDAAVERLGALKREATGGKNSATTTNESDPVVKPAPEASTAGAAVPTNAHRSSSATTIRAPQTAPPRQLEKAAPPIQPANAAASSQPANGSLSPGVGVPTTAGTSAQGAPVERRDREVVAARSRSAEPMNEPASGGLIADENALKVPASVMEANLVTSRVPAYPEAAKSEGIEGRVVMEAAISKSGMVDHVRVIEGDRQLRSAAEEAVLEWRFRPYLVNGQPVDVLTMIRVDFRLGSSNSR